MALGSYARDALVELDAEDLDRMLGLDETLFVEHKTDLGKDSENQLIEAVAAFANTLGGWLLLGVHGQKVVSSGDSVWVRALGNAPLVDVVRARLRGQLDPLPAFEARVLEHRDGKVGVVRVYESSDTPHVVLRSGAVFVREPGGKSDASAPARPGSGARAERAYTAARIRSREQLLELAGRGRQAEERVRMLLEALPISPGVRDGLKLHLGYDPVAGVTPAPSSRASICVRLAPYTLSARYRGWSTTTDAAAALLAAGEHLAGIRGLRSEWATPHPTGGSLELPATAYGPERHVDGDGRRLPTTVRAVVENAGVVGAALELGTPENDYLYAMWRLKDFARALILPVLETAAGLLRAGEFPGRVRCAVDLIAVPRALRVEHQGDRLGADWVPFHADVTLPAPEAELDGIALRSAYAYARAIGVPAWDAPPT